MMYKHSQKTNPNQPTVYQIRVQGHLSPQRAEWFGGLTLSLTEDSDTLLTGPIADQAALFGLLRKVRDSGLALIALNPLKPGSADASTNK